VGRALSGFRQFGLPCHTRADFLAKTGLLMDLRSRAFHFTFDPTHQLRLCSDSDHVPVDSSFNGAQFLEEIDDLSHLSEGQVSVISQLLRDFPQVFIRKLGLTTLVEYDIQLTDTVPVRSSPYRLSPPKMTVLRRQIQEMLDKGIIRYSVSPYSSPIFLVPKGETDFRPVVDFRALNKMIVIESVPLPDIHTFMFPLVCCSHRFHYVGS
jgi:hypothetical protein